MKHVRVARALLLFVSSVDTTQSSRCFCENSSEQILDHCISFGPNELLDGRLVKAHAAVCPRPCSWPEIATVTSTNAQ